MKRHHIRQIAIDIAIELFASFLCAIGLYNFAVSANFPISGVSGITTILYYLFDLPIGIMTIVVNIPIAVLCYRRLGKSFFWRSVRCIIFGSVMTDYVAPLFPLYTGDRMLSAICTAAICGIGYALIYMRGSSTGGTDFITVSIKSAHPHLPLGRISFTIESLIVLAGGIIYRDVDGVIYGLIINFIQGIVVDKLMYGINAGKLALIITDHGSRVARVIEECSNRGSTIIDVKGAFQHEEKQMVLCACSSKQMYEVEQAVKAAAPESFIIILESNEVHGEGFSITRVAQRPARIPAKGGKQLHLRKKK